MDIVATRSVFLDELGKVSRKLRTLFDARAKAHGLTHSRARLLIQLARADGSTQAQLADKLEVEQPSIVGLVDALEKHGLVTRQPNAQDRRVNGVYLTAKAHREVEGLLHFVDQLREQIIGELDDEDILTATRVLQTIARNIGAVS